MSGYGVTKRARCRITTTIAIAMDTPHYIDEPATQKLTTEYSHVNQKSHKKQQINIDGVVNTE